MTLDRAGYYRDTIFSKHFETHFISMYLRYLQEKIELEIRKRCSIDDYLKAIANIRVVKTKNFGSALDM